uniref:MAK10-like protein n=1 Tax=Tanacetum cinerariifolium TaxID=118510 RepID=A0A6L2KNY2_TANCI|nr:hypothetical protein [Tanacetum cinerariifolium]
MDFAKLVKEITLPQDVPSTSDRRLIELENQVQRLMEAHLAPMQPTQVNKVTTICKICSGPHDTQYCMEDLKQAFMEYASSCTDETGVGTAKLIKGEFEIIKDVKVEDVSLTCDTPLEVFNNEHEADDDMGYDPSDVAFTEWLGLKNFNYKTMDHYTMKALWIYYIRGDDEVEFTDEEFYDNEDEVAEVFRIDTNLFELGTPMCKAFKEFNYLLQIDPYLLTKDIERSKTYEDYKNYWIYECNKDVPWVDEKPWTNAGVWTKPTPVKHTCKPFNWPNRNDDGIEWLDVEEPLDLVDTSEESVYESLIKKMPKCSLNHNFRIKKDDPRNLKIPCMIGHKFTANAYIDVDLPMNIMSLAYYNSIRINGYECMGRNFVGLGRDMHVFVGNMSYVMDFTILESIENNIDPSLSNIEFERPFVEIACLAINRKYGLMTFTNRIKEITFKTPYQDPERSELSSEGHDLLSSRVILSEEDYDRGCRKPSDLEDGLYRDTIKLGPDNLDGMDDEGEVT